MLRALLRTQLVLAVVVASCGHGGDTLQRLEANDARIAELERAIDELQVGFTTTAIAAEPADSDAGGSMPSASSTTSAPGGSVAGITVDQSACVNSESSTETPRLECLGRVLEPQFLGVYAFRIVGFDILGQAPGVMDEVDARSSCGRLEWGRFDVEAGQIMWIRLASGGTCDVELHLPSGVISSSIIADF